jgi:hypothetical protein
MSDEASRRSKGITFEHFRSECATMKLYRLHGGVDHLMETSQRQTVRGTNSC